MALEEFENEEEKKKDRGDITRGTRHYIMGSLWVGLGIYLLLGYQSGQGRDLLVNIFAVASVLYGAYRIYRGFKKQE
jgi:hypothetical protein